jgi:hypothetical protein
MPAAMAPFGTTSSAAARRRAIMSSQCLSTCEETSFSCSRLDIQEFVYF